MVIVNSPQPLAVGEKPQNVADVINTTYASQLHQKQAAATISKLELFPVSIIHGEPTIEFTRDEINDFTREEGLHQAVVMKFSYGKPELQEIRRVFSIQFDVQGRCNIGQLDYRHILVRFDLYTDFVQFLSRSTGYIKDKDDEYFYRTFPWTFDFNPKEETTMAVVWISLPGLPTNLFAKKSLLSIASAAGKVLAVDKATQDRTRPSTGRVKVILDLLDNHPKKVKLRIVDKTTGKSLVLYQEIVYDNLPSYCCYCKHQGHDERTCRILKEKTGQNLVAAVDRNRQVDRNLPVVDSSTVEKLKGDAREFLNAKKMAHNKDQIAEKQANNIRQHVLQVGKSKVDVTGIELSPVTAGRYANKSNAAGFENTLAQHGKVPDVHIEDNLKLTKGFHKSSSDIPISIVSARMHNAIADTLTSATDRAYDCGQHLNATNIISQTNARISKGLEQHVAKDNVDKFTCENEEKLATQEVNNLGKAGSVSIIAGVTSVTSDIVEPTVQTSTLKAAGVRGSANKGAGQFPTGQENKIDQQASATSFDLIEKPAAQLTTAVQIGQLLLDGNVVRDHLERVESQNSDIQALQNSNGRDWTEVNRSSNKPNYPVIANQSTTSKNVSVSNTFDALLNESMWGDAEKKEQHVSQDLASTFRLSKSTGEDKQQQSMKNAITGPKLKKNLALVTVDKKKNAAVPNATVSPISLSNPDVDKLVKNAQTEMVVNTTTGNKAHSSNTPTLHFSSHQVEKIINDAQIAMAVHTTTVNQPIVTLNTSVFEIPSQSMESYGEHGGESGQMVLSTGNNDETIRANLRGMAIKSKLWADKSDYEDDEDYGDAYAGNSIEDDDYDSGDEGVLSVGSPVPKIDSSAKLHSINKLSANAPDFVPKAGRQQQGNTTIPAVEAGQMQQLVHITVIPSTTAATMPTGQQQLLPATPAQQNRQANGNQQQQLKIPGQQQHLTASSGQHSSSSPVANQRTTSPNKTVTVDRKKAEQQHIFPVTVAQGGTGEQLIVPGISLEEKKLLEDLVSSDPRHSLNTLGLSTGRVSRSRNKLENKEQNKVILVNKKEGSTMVTQGYDQDMPNPVKVGRDIYEEGEEDDILNRYREEASRKGDLSPMHSKKGKKTRIRERSWDGRVNENVRRLPMRVAKQKQAYPTTSTKSTRSRK